MLPLLYCRRQRFLRQSGLPYFSTVLEFLCAPALVPRAHPLFWLDLLKRIWRVNTAGCPQSAPAAQTLLDAPKAHPLRKHCWMPPRRTCCVNTAGRP